MLLRSLARLTRTSAPASALSIRLAVGGVFLSEGIQKFLFPAALGAARFAKIGIPLADVLAPIVGGFEIVCGTLVLFGLLTRLALVPLIVVMVVALASTKIPILLQSGLWKMAGGGRWSLDARATRKGQGS